MIRCLTLAFCLICSSLVAAAEPPDVREFTTLYPVDARKVERAYRSLTLKTRQEFPSRPGDVFLSNFAANGDYVRTDEGSSIVVAGPQRSFAVLPKKGKENEFELIKIGVGAVAYEKQLAHLRLKCELIHFPYNFYEVPLVDIFKRNPEYKLERILPETIDGRAAFTVQVQETMEDGLLRNLDFTFPVEHPWIVLRRKIWVKDKYRQWEARYDDAIAGVPLPTELKCISNDDGPASVIYTNKITKLVKQPLPISEFQLSRYGIEDTFEAPFQFDFIWVAACGIVSILLAIWIRRRMRDE